MPSQEEKARRKQILDELANKQQKEFNDSLPLSREKFQLLEKVSNVDEVIKWLEEHGGYCDCEVLANIDEQFN